MDGSGRLGHVAIKTCKQSVDRRGRDIDDERQVQLLGDIQGLRHQHIMEMMAVLKTEVKGSLFMYQWADGGNLRDLYRKCPNPVLSATFLRQLVSQLWGLSSALCHVHNFNPTDNRLYRHGNLKPENILRFENGTSVGVLKISDLGLLQYHVGETRGSEPIDIIFGTNSYEPPEVMLDFDLAVSRQYDIWSIGCVFLELLIWVFYGHGELEEFNQSIDSAIWNHLDYWVMGGTDRRASVNPIVVDLMEIMAKKLALVGTTAIGDFLELIRTRLLVVPVARGTGTFEQSSNSSFSAPSGFRAHAADLELHLKRIAERAELDEGYAYTPIMERGSVSQVQAIQRKHLADSHLAGRLIINHPKPFLSNSHPNSEVLTENVDYHEAAEVNRMPVEEHGLTSASPHDLTGAIESHDRDRAHWLLESFFDQIAVQEYSWLTELKQLGFSPEEIADQLLEKAILGPWIHEPFNEPHSEVSIPNFHQNGCVHADSRNERAIYVGDPTDFVNSICTSPHGRNVIVSDPEVGSDDEETSQLTIEGLRGNMESPSTTKLEKGGMCLSARQRIEYFCGLGGGRPAADGSTKIEFGSVSFEENNSRASITLDGSEHTSVVLQVLNGLDQAAGELQRLGGCCDSFSVLVTDSSRRNTVLQQVPFWTIRGLRELVLDPERNDYRSSLYDLFYNLFGTTEFMSGDSDDAGSLPHWVLLATQFLALGLLSYAQAHCGPIQPFYLDTPVRTISLLGSGKSRPGIPHTTLSCHLVELTCMGDMVGEQVLAFDCPAVSVVDEKPITPSPVVPRKHMLASPVDILDTWGPGCMVASANDPNILYSVSVGGGTITCTGTSTTLQLHWSKEFDKTTTRMYAFPRDQKSLIGATITENNACQSAAARLGECQNFLQEIGTSTDSWHVMERQLGFGLQGGETGVAIFQFHQTWVKMPGVTKKSAMLSRRVIYVSDLDHMLGVQVSICTGIARRVRLRDLLADLLPAYVAELSVEPEYWKDLVNNANALEALRESDIKEWLEALDRPSRVEFEALVFAVLCLLRDTGIDRRTEEFVVACVQIGFPRQCFKIPCNNESSWSRVLMDSKDSATFAYVTTQCLETADLKCSRPSPSWSNSTTLMGTAVLEDTVASDRALAVAPGLSQWTLRENQIYLMGPSDRKLYVQVRRPIGLDPLLMVSPSTIPPAFLHRILRREKLKKLREKKHLENHTERVVVCAPSPT